MAKLTLEELLEQVKALTPAEQQKVREMLDTLPPHQPTPEEEDEFERELLAEGIISRIPRRDPEHYRHYQPVEIEGKPLSETIIEERR